MKKFDKKKYILKQKAHDEGYEAFKEGFLPNSCPYLFGIFTKSDIPVEQVAEAASAWLSGWTLACEEQFGKFFRVNKDLTLKTVRI